jgi:hypothetical protein
MRGFTTPSLETRPRREQRRGSPPRPQAAWAECDRPPLDPRRRRRCGEAVLRDDRADARPRREERPFRTRPHCCGRSLVHARGPPTENFHLAFPAPDDATVDDFDRVAVAVALPGQRPARRATEYTLATTPRSCTIPTRTASRPVPQPAPRRHWSGGWRRRQSGERCTRAPTRRHAPVRRRYAASFPRAVPRVSTS